LSQIKIWVPDFLAYEYDVDGFDKIVSFDGNYVIKFKATIVERSDILRNINQILWMKDTLKEKKMKKNKFVIVIPLYNAKDLIEECLASILTQDYGDLGVMYDYVNRWN
jgi:hypothetical protein